MKLSSCSLPHLYQVKTDHANLASAKKRNFLRSPITGMHYGGTFPCSKLHYTARFLEYHYSFPLWTHHSSERITPLIVGTDCRLYLANSHSLKNLFCRIVSFACSRKRQPPLVMILEVKLVILSKLWSIQFKMLQSRVWDMRFEWQCSYEN